MLRKEEIGSKLQNRHRNLQTTTKGKRIYMYIHARVVRSANCMYTVHVVGSAKHIHI